MALIGAALLTHPIEADEAPAHPKFFDIDIQEPEGNVLHMSGTRPAPIATIHVDPRFLISVLTAKPWTLRKVGNVSRRMIVLKGTKTMKISA